MTIEVLKRMDKAREKRFARHYGDCVSVDAPAEEVFAYADDHTKFSSHMGQSSWMMGGGRMDVSVDDGHGQKVGSHIRMGGKVLGIRLFLDEVVTRHEPPRLKAWETVGDLRLLVIGHYGMGIRVEPQGGGSLFCVSIDYDLPSRNAWLGRLFGGAYAKWCVNQMIKGVREHFGKP